MPLNIREVLGFDPNAGTASTFTDNWPDFASADNYRMVGGMSRTADVARFGIPLGVDANITNTNQLGLSGATAAQFKILNRYPNGNAQWILVDTLASVSAGGVNSNLALVSGSGAFGGANLASTSNGLIVVNTGVATFEIATSKFDLFHRVILANGTEVVSPSNSSGIVLTGTDGVVYQSSLDPNVQVSIEENGPVQAIVLIKGTHVSTAGARNLDYTLRLRFTKGLSRVGAAYVLRNASRHQVANAQIRDLELRLQSNAAIGQAVFAQPSNAETSVSLTPSDSANLFQGMNSYPVSWSGNSTLMSNTTIQGYTLTKNGTAVASGAASDVINLFYASAKRGDQNQIRIGTRFAAAYLPQGLSIEGSGLLHLGLFPKGNNQSYFVRFNSHLTREAFFDFTPAAGSLSAHDSFFAFQYPLFGKAQDHSYYNKTNGIYEKLVSFKDQYNMLARLGFVDPTKAITYCNPGDPNACAAKGTINMRPEPRVRRSYGYSAGGGFNQYDHGRRAYINFLKDDSDYSGGFLLEGLATSGFDSDQGLYWGDDWDLTQGASEAGIDAYRWNNPVFGGLPLANQVPYSPNIEGDHMHASGIGMAYYLTGDERFRDAYLDFAQMLLCYNEWYSEDRTLAWRVFNEVDMYRFTADTRFRDMASNDIQQQIRVGGDVTGYHPGNPGAVAGVSYGMDWKRGFFVAMHDQWDWYGTAYTERSMASFIKGSMYPRTLDYFIKYAAASNAEANQVRSLLQGQMGYAANELWFEFGQNIGDYGFPYRITPENPYRDVRTDPDWYSGVREAYGTFIQGYILTGDPEYLRKGKLLIKGAANSDNSFVYNFPEYEQLTELVDNPSVVDVWKEVPVKVTQTAAGTYTVSWTVPANAKLYNLKYSTKVIVPWLGFNRQTLTYAYDPNTFVPEFAATDFGNEPAPGAAGTTQSVVVSGLSVGQGYNFVLRYLSGN